MKILVCVFIGVLIVLNVSADVSGYINHGVSLLLTMILVVGATAFWKLNKQ